MPWSSLTGLTVFCWMVCPLDACALLETVLRFFQFFSQFSSQNVSRSVSNQAVHRTTVAKEEKCWSAHDSIFPADVSISIAGKDVQFCEFQFALEISGDRVQLWVKSLTPDARIVPEIHQDELSRSSYLLVPVLRFQADYCSRFGCFHEDTNNLRK